MIDFKFLLNQVFIDENIYFYTIDHLFRKVVIFSGKYILEFSLVDKGGSIKKSKYFNFFIRKFENINNIYEFSLDKSLECNNKNISRLINKIIINEHLLYKFFLSENISFFNKTFNGIKINKKILFILKGGGMEEIIEKSFISYCNNSNLDLTVLYKFGTGYWGQKLNQDGFFNELKANNPNIKFIYNEYFDDIFIDSLVDDNTEIFSFQYNYKGKYDNLNMIIISSVAEDIIDCVKYKNIFTTFLSKTIGYSTDKFINYEKSRIYKQFNSQDIPLLRNYIFIKKPPDLIFAGGMSWSRDFSIINSLNGEYKGIMVSDEKHNIKNFIDNYRGIQSYYGFFGAFLLSNFTIICHLDEHNNDDRTKIISTSICSGKPVIFPFYKGLISDMILSNKLGIAYENGNIEDFLNKVRFFTENKDNIVKYSKNCLEYSKHNMDINKFINLIFATTFKDE